MESKKIYVVHVPQEGKVGGIDRTCLYTNEDKEVKYHYEGRLFDPKTDAPLDVPHYSLWGFNIDAPKAKPTLWQKIKRWFGGK